MNEFTKAMPIMRCPVHTCGHVFTIQDHSPCPSCHERRHEGRSWVDFIGGDRTKRLAAQIALDNRFNDYNRVGHVDITIELAADNKWLALAGFLSATPFSLGPGPSATARADVRGQVEDALSAADLLTGESKT